MSVQGNVVTLFERTAIRMGDRPAILGPDGRVHWSFGQLAERAASLAGGLAGEGIGAGDRVLVLEPDIRRRYAAVGAVLWVGATVLAPPATLSPWRAIAAAASAGPRAVIFGPALWPLVIAHPGLRSIPSRIATAGPRIAGAMSFAVLAGAPVDPAAVGGETPALASFTTGSTGEPKLVVRSHDVLRAQHDALQRLRSLPEDDVDLVGLPALVLHNLAAGVTSVLASADVGASRYGATVRETIARARPTSAVGFPHLFESAAEGADPGAFHSLRAIHVGGSRVKGELVRVLAGLAPGARLGVVYGSTEVEPIAAIEGEPYLDALAGSDATAGVCVGRPVEGLELRLEPDGVDDRPFGERPGGTIVVRGRHAAARPGEWLTTGDVGWVDEDSRLWLLGRTANAVGGVRPFEVELALERLDWVRHASLTRVGEAGTPRLALAVEPRDRGGASRARQVADVRDLIAEHGWPVDEVVVRSRLPRIRGDAAKPDVARGRRRGTHLPAVD